MIDKKFIESAIRIRKEYLIVRNGINNYDQISKKLVSDLSGTMDDFKKLSEDIDNKSITNAETAQAKIFVVIQDLETKMNKIISKIDSLNEDIEKLKKEELELYNQIKKKHPSLQDSDIVKEISQFLSA